MLVAGVRQRVSGSEACPVEAEAAPRRAWRASVGRREALTGHGHTQSPEGNVGEAL